MNTVLLRLREWFTFPDEDRESRILVNLYQSCRTRDEKAACALLIASRLDEMAETASANRRVLLLDDAQEWRHLADQFSQTP